MFLVDISPSMGKVRTVDLPGEDRSIEMTNLQWALQFIKLKIQEMVCSPALAVDSAFMKPNRYSMVERLTNVVSSHLVQMVHIRPCRPVGVS